MDKLIRDKILDIIKAKGDPLPEYYLAVEERFTSKLRDKLTEEVNEYLSSPSIEELADIIEVVSALAKRVHRVRLEQVLEVADQKREERGGFDLGIVADFSKTKSA